MTKEHHLSQAKKLYAWAGVFFCIWSAIMIYSLVVDEAKVTGALGGLGVVSISLFANARRHVQKAQGLNSEDTD